MKNVNIGVVGHVDSGKTSICRLLSKVRSTASLDKSKQSQERGITLDLGFSCFVVGNVQVTLVDCPGHSTLMKTVLGAAAIIDYLMLVIDLQKGIQPQTAECIVLASILAKPVVVLLNKADLVQQQSERTAKVKQIDTILNKLQLLHWMYVVSGVSGEGVEQLLQGLEQTLEVPSRPIATVEGFSVLVDHCFQLKGQGTVATGTVVHGLLQVGDQVEFSQLVGGDKHKKVLNIQMFHQNIKQARAGDRVAMLFKAFAPSSVDRCIVSSKGFYTPCTQAIFTFNPVPFYKHSLKSKQQYHITSGHQTIMATLYLIQCLTSQQQHFQWDKEYTYQLDYQQQNNNKYKYFMVLDLSHPMLVREDTEVIGSNLASNNHKECRLGFYGQLVSPVDLSQQKLKVYKVKTRGGRVDKWLDPYTLLVVGLFTKHTNIHIYINYPIQIFFQQQTIHAKVFMSFGNSGKVKVQLQQQLDQQYSLLIKDAPVQMVYKKYFLNKKQNK